MKLIQAPNSYRGPTPTLYLAGPIQAGAWRAVLAERLVASPWTLLDPTRHDFADLDGRQRRAHVEWELAHLRRATAVLFWLAPPTPCPLTLLELGLWAAGSQPGFVGIHPRFALDDTLRMRLAVLRPDLRLATTLDTLAEQVLTFPDETSPLRLTA